MSLGRKTIFRFKTYDTMLSKLFWCFWSVSIITAKPLTTTKYQALDLTLSSIPSELLFSPNQPITTVNISIDNSFTVQCDGTRFGRNPDLADCQSARSYIIPDSEQRTWVQRHQPGQTGEVFPLPFRGMGGRSRLQRRLEGH